MIDLKDLRANPEKYRRGAAQKQQTVDLDRLLELDEHLGGSGLSLTIGLSYYTTQYN